MQILYIEISFWDYKINSSKFIGYKIELIEIIRIILPAY